jgi:hypothetical protein
MANTTFSGPVRSENGFKTIVKNETTGAITEIATLGTAPVALADGNVTLTNATHSGRALIVPEWYAGQHLHAACSRGRFVLHLRLWRRRSRCDRLHHRHRRRRELLHRRRDFPRHRRWRGFGCVLGRQLELQAAGQCTGCCADPCHGSRRHQLADLGNRCRRDCTCVRRSVIGGRHGRF